MPNNFDMKADPLHLSAMLQGHIDMVCEKNNDVQHDIHKDALKLVKNGDWLKVYTNFMSW